MESPTFASPISRHELAQGLTQGLTKASLLRDILLHDAAANRAGRYTGSPRAFPVTPRLAPDLRPVRAPATPRAHGWAYTLGLLPISGFWGS